MGHNTLGKIVGEMIREAGFEGHYTNHSLCVTSATRLFNAEVDEQLIMTRTGHSSTDGVVPTRGRLTNSDNSHHNQH